MGTRLVELKTFNLSGTELDDKNILKIFYLWGIECKGDNLHRRIKHMIRWSKNIMGCYVQRERGE